MPDELPETPETPPEEPSPLVIEVAEVPFPEPPAIEAVAEEPAEEEPVAEAEPDPEEAAEASPDAPAAEPVENKKRWYVVKVQSGREESIKEAIERKVRIEGLEEFYGQILIPVERIQELRRGKRVTKSIKLYPGYLFAEVEFNDRILYLFRETSGVGDFVGGGPGGRAPTPMPTKEVEAMILQQTARPEPSGQAGEAGVKPREVIRTRPRFSVGDRLKVIDGNFSGMEGEVIDITDEKVKLQVPVLGVPLTLDLDFWQVEVV